MTDLVMTPSYWAIIIFGAVCLGCSILAAVFGILNQIARYIGGWKRLGAALAVISFLCLCVAVALWGK